MSVSDTIGKLLLEGYKMLAESCDVCYTVLMQDRRGRVICVKCESTSMANAGPGDEIATTVKMSNGGSTLNTGSVPARSESAAVPSGGLQNGSPAASTVSSCESVLIKEIEHATTSLELMRQHQQDMQGKLLHIKYIRECAETIQALQALKRA